MKAHQDFDQLLNRGVEQVLPDKDSLQKLLSEKKITLYLGIDPTGSLLHLGHSVVLRKLQQFVAAGHHVILLIGSGTARIGDPTGRDSSRPEITDEQIATNFRTWQDQAARVLDFDHLEVRYNGDWLDKLNYSQILKLMASTTVQQLIERDMFQERIKKGLPIFGHEIMYPLLQGYDSVVMDVDLEIGGTDQTFNMLMGRHLQKVYNNREKWVLTTPIIDGLDGRKMSKSFNNYVALTEPPHDMYGKIMSLNDNLIIQYFTILTDRSTTEINEIATEIQSGVNPMQFKKLLAHDLVTFYYNDDTADEAADFFKRTVQNKELPENTASVKIPSDNIKLKDLIKLCTPQESISNIKRLIEQGGVELVDFDNSILTPETEFLSVDLNGQIVRVGKRKFFQIISS